jgi:hypothetical protein
MKQLDLDFGDDLLKNIKVKDDNAVIERFEQEIAYFEGLILEEQDMLKTAIIKRDIINIDEGVARVNNFRACLFNLRRALPRSHHLSCAHIQSDKMSKELSAAQAEIDLNSEEVRLMRFILRIGSIAEELGGAYSEISKLTAMAMDGKNLPAPTDGEQ